MPLPHSGLTGAPAREAEGAEGADDDRDRELARLRRRVERERRARMEAEAITEATTSRLYALVQELQSQRDVLEATTDLVVLAGADAVTYLNRASLRFWGLEPEQVAGLDGRWLPGVLEAAGARAGLWDALAGEGTWHGELVLTAVDGVEVPVSCVVAAHGLPGDERPAVSMIARDISDRRALEAELLRQATHDSLTGLPNRAVLVDHLRKALARADRSQERIGVLFCDLDRFKAVNDQHGHEAGDRLLATVADRLRSTMRAGDTVARFGGDEFVVLCHDVEGDDLDAVAERLNRIVAEPVDVGSAEAHVSLSVGIAVGGQGVTAEHLIRHADVAMYAAKRAGKARAERYRGDLEEMAADAIGELELRRAIEQGELVLHFQPEVPLALGRADVLACEALVRWQHPTRGLLLPSEFLPAAVAAGVVVPLGAWVLDQALAQVAAWRAGRATGSGAPARVGVNLSRAELDQADLVEKVRAALAAHDLPGGALRVEVAEHDLLLAGREALDGLAGLRALGVGVAVDDFGTGYSHTAHLRRIAVDVLKVHGSFVADLPRDPDAVALVRAVVVGARELGIATVAECVETQEQLELLRSLGCDGAQGFLLGCPAPAAG